MTGIACDRCGILDATQVLRSGVYCAECYVFIKIK